MSLKAGRVGVAPDQVDEFGKIKSEATSGYTKQEADAKFETKTDAAAALAEKQPINLQVPLEMLDGTKLTVEAALQALNDGFKISTGEITTDFTKNETLTVLKKYGRLVVLQVALTGVTKAAYTNALCTLPAEYRPVKNIAVCGVLGRNNIARCTILTSGAIQSAIDLTNQEVYITACWLI